MWKDVGSSPALKGCGWFWFSSTIYMFSFWKWEWGLQIRSQVFPLPQLKCAQCTRLFCSAWPFESLSAYRNSACPYTPYCALLSGSNFSNLVVKNWGAYTALACKYLCQGKSRHSLLRAFIIIRAMLCSGIISSIANTLLCRHFFKMIELLVWFFCYMFVCFCRR